MLGITMSTGIFLVTLLTTATRILGQQLFRSKPWPTYSLQNMPQTKFTCQDKILGGYYADAETQCQMFHVCVKVAGVGVQDFRFLCPNGTAFDQEAQICADWGDVDCEQSVLYYGSDNFDLYRIGSGFESKRAPFAEEEEATFHLQRAESADIRRSKETRVDQKVRPDQPPNYSKHLDATPRNTFNNYLNFNVNNRNNYEQKQQKNVDVTKRPIVNYYTPTIATTSTTTTTTTPKPIESYNDDSKQELDDIFKGSHSSHFFSNRNGGREDDLNDQPKKQSKKTDYNAEPPRRNRLKPSTTTTTTVSSPTATTKIIQRVKTTPAIKVATVSVQKSQQKFSTQSAYNFETSQRHKFSTPSFATTAQTTTKPTTTSEKLLQRGGQHRFNFNLNEYPTNENIKPTTYNPTQGFYHFKTTTPKYTELARVNSTFGKTSKTSKITGDGGNPLLYDVPKIVNKTTIASRKSQKLQANLVKSNLPVNNSSIRANNKKNDFNEYPNIVLQQPQPFQSPQKVRTSLQPQNNKPSKTKSKINLQISQPYNANYDTQTTRTRTESRANIGAQSPAPFSKPRKQESNNDNIKLNVNAFTSRVGSQYQKSTTSRYNDFHTSSVNEKKFSTLVTNEFYTPTTFKPTTNKNAIDYSFYQTQQQTVRPTQKAKAITSTTSTAPPTANPYYNPDEDDGQYHPELYEIDYSPNNFNLGRSTPATTTTTKITTKKQNYYQQNNFQSPQSHLRTQQQTSFKKQQEQATAVDISDEEELFKTAHSLNFGAASINKLRADIIKAEKTSQQYNSQYSPSIDTKQSKTPPPQSTTVFATTPTKRPTYSSTTFVATTPPTITSSVFTKTSKPTTTTSTSTSTTTTTTTTTTTKRPFTTQKQPTTYDISKSTKSPSLKPSKHSKSNKDKGKKKVVSKRPPHADEDTSYDYAYYDTDTLSESPQDYQEYEISEFSKTPKN